MQNSGHSYICGTIKIFRYAIIITGIQAMVIIQGKCWASPMKTPDREINNAKCKRRDCLTAGF